MKRTALELAALASAAVPELSPAGVREMQDYDEDFVSAFIIDNSGEKWVVRSPLREDAGTQIDSDYSALEIFTPALRPRLPFKVPNIVGRVANSGKGQAAVYTFLDGDQVNITEGNVPEDYALSLGGAISAIHNLDTGLVEESGLPYYTADDCRKRRKVELQQATNTGKIPENLVKRWNNALDDDSLWEFEPSVVHGKLNEESILEKNNKVHAIQNWSQLHVGDPAEDLGWIVATNNGPLFKTVLSSYTARLKKPADKKLLIRAEMNAEFALAQWLLHGYAIEDAETIREATGLLNDLDDHITTRERLKEEARLRAIEEKRQAEEAARLEEERKKAEEAERKRQEEARKREEEARIEAEKQAKIEAERQAKREAEESRRREDAEHKAEEARKRQEASLITVEKSDDYDNEFDQYGDFDEDEVKVESADMIAPAQPIKNKSAVDVLRQSAAAKIEETGSIVPGTVEKTAAMGASSALPPVTKTPVEERVSKAPVQQTPGETRKFSAPAAPKPAVSKATAPVSIETVKPKAAPPKPAPVTTKPAPKPAPVTQQPKITKDEQPSAPKPTEKLPKATAESQPASAPHFEAHISEEEPKHTSFQTNIVTPVVEKPAGAPDPAFKVDTTSKAVNDNAPSKEDIDFIKKTHTSDTPLLAPSTAPDVKSPTISASVSPQTGLIPQVEEDNSKGKFGSRFKSMFKTSDEATAGYKPQTSDFQPGSQEQEPKADTGLVRLINDTKSFLSSDVKLPSKNKDEPAIDEFQDASPATQAMPPAPMAKPPVPPKAPPAAPATEQNQTVAPQAAHATPSATEATEGKQKGLKSRFSDFGKKNKQKQDDPSPRTEALSFDDMVSGSMPAVKPTQQTPEQPQLPAKPEVDENKPPQVGDVTRRRIVRRPTPLDTQGIPKTAPRHSTGQFQEVSQADSAEKSTTEKPKRIVQGEATHVNTEKVMQPAQNPSGSGKGKKGLTNEGEGITWVAGSSSATAPEGFPVKGNENSMLFHLPNTKWYQETEPERYYKTYQDAMADGFKPAGGKRQQGI